MNTNYEALQSWLAYLADQPVALMLAGAAILWIFAQMLDNSWDGGKLFERKYAWVSTSVAALIVFALFVVPNASLALVMGVIGVAILVLVAVFQRKNWH